MIRITDVTEENWLDVAGLSVKEEQKGFLAPAIGILARGYVYRNCNARVWVIENDEAVVGAALVREFDDEPLGYDLQQFMIDGRYQGRGFGSRALEAILDALIAAGSFDDPMFALARQFAAADEVVIAAPLWDLSFPPRR